MFGMVPPGIEKTPEFVTEVKGMSDKLYEKHAQLQAEARKKKT